MTKQIRRLSIVLILMLLFLSAACGKSSEEAALKQTVEDNFQAMNDKDLTKYMSMLSKDADPNVITQTESTMKNAFENFDLHATLKRFKVISIDGDTAVIEVEQDTINSNDNPQFKNNRIIAEHTLKKEDGQWKFKSTVIRSAKQIDKSGNVIGELQ
ncbi:nuclear transport factor 2 family protein [Shimazuella sp. AN120528]|uniref:nuclear transport factor 2 family protein n=1 Tax=Shimazuella soli TaxID=1892854 RepID=UPI001F0EE7E0|nr:nuclear transport factor 2 family protein [Shimazuella soli]MCH5586654.1 nuclear transport factor 2 family protein [Shimazuella soli]